MQEIRKFIFPGAVALIGLAATILGFQTGQNAMYTFGALALFLAGGISLVAAVTSLSKVLRMTLSGILVVLVAALSYANYMSIKVPIDFKNEKDKRYAHVKQRLIDIRTTELAYKAKYQKYSGSFDTLISFLKYDSIPFVKANGIVPDTMTLEEALAAEIVTRDTSYVNALDSLFGSQDPEKREHKFVADSLRFVPFTGGAEFDLQAGTVEKSSVKVSVFQAEDSKPFDKGDVYRVGSLSDPKTNGNWE